MTHCEKLYNYFLEHPKATADEVMSALDWERREGKRYKQPGQRGGGFPTTGYRRTTVFLPQSEKNPVASRMTVDNALTWTPLSENILMAGVNYRNFHGNLVGTTYGLPNAVIIETKSGVEPSVADQHLWDAGITPAKISKFATGMAALNPQLASNKWEETLKNWMHLEPVNGTRLNVDDMTEEDYQKLLTERFAAA